MTVFVELEPGADKQGVEEAVRAHCKTKIGITIVPKAVAVGELPRSEKKSTRIFDNRY